MDWHVLEMLRDMEDEEDEDLERGTWDRSSPVGKENRGDERNQTPMHGSTSIHSDGMGKKEERNSRESDAKSYLTPSEERRSGPVHDWRTDMGSANNKRPPPSPEPKSKSPSLHQHEIRSVQSEDRKSSDSSRKVGVVHHPSPSCQHWQTATTSPLSKEKQEQGGGGILVRRNQGLQTVAAATRGYTQDFLETVEILDVSNNAISSLVEVQGLLPNLHTLKFSNNKIPSKHTLVVGLRQCQKLRSIEMSRCGKWAREPSSYVAEIFRELPALEYINGVPNPRPLTSQQWRVARFLNRIFQIGPNELASIDLDHRDIAGEEFPIILRSLSHLKPLRLWIKNNPASNLRSYRLQVIHMVGDSLIELDGQQVTFNEKANAKRAMKELKQQLEAYQIELHKKGHSGKERPDLSPMLHDSPHSAVYQGGATLSPTTWMAQSSLPGHQSSSWYNSPNHATGNASEQQCRQENSEPNSTSSIVTCHPRKLDFERAAHDEGESEIRPADESDRLATTPCLQRRGAVRFNVEEPSHMDPEAMDTVSPLSFHNRMDKRAPPCTNGAPMKVSVMSVASKGLCEDLEDFVTSGDGTIVIENADDPNWYSKLWSTPLEVITGRLMAKVEQVFNYFQIYMLIYLLDVEWPDFWTRFNTSWKLSEIIVNILPSLNFSNATSKMSLAASKTLFVLTLLIPAGLYWLYRVDSLICCKLSPISCFATTIARAEHFLRRKVGYTLRQLRGRVSLFLMTIIYLPLSRTCLYTLEPFTDDATGELVIRQFPRINWPTVEGFTFSEHWVMILAGLGVLLYVLGIPLFFLKLVLNGTREAEQAYDLPHMEEEIKLSKEELATCDDPEDRTRLRGALAAKETAKRLLYAKAVRRYVNAQAYVYQEYKQSSKAYKVFVMGQKTFILILVLYLREPVVRGSRASIVQSFLVFAISVAAVLVSALRKPYEASSENMIESIFWSANVFNAFVALLLASTTAEDPEEEPSVFRSDAVGVTLLVVNALAFCLVLGIVGATPRLHSLAKEQDQQMKSFIFAMQSERVRAELDDSASPFPSPHLSDPPSGVIRRTPRPPPPPPPARTTPNALPSPPSLLPPSPRRPAPSPPTAASGGSYHSVSL